MRDQTNVRVQNPDRRALLERLVRSGVELRRRATVSYAQERLWFLDQLHPGNTAYNIPLTVRLRGELDVEALRSALEGLVRRHETLRTAFRSEGGRPVQMIEPAERTHVVLPVVEIHGSMEDRERKSARLAFEEAVRPFDLCRGPLLRVLLLWLQDDEHMLLLTLHHIVSDGWSMGVLVRELGALYNAARQGRDAQLPELTVQYADYAAWQREWLQGKVLEEQLSYWRDKLADTAVLQLLTDRRRPAMSSQRGGRVPVALTRAVVDQLRGLCQQEKATLFMLLLGGFQVLLARYSGQSDIAVGTAIANRTRREVEGLIGFFVNTLVLRTEIDEEMSFRHLMARVREVTLGAYAHQDLPFERLVEELRPERDLAHTPLFQVSFALQNLPTAELEVADLTLEARAVENGTTKFDLSVSLRELDDGSMAGSFDYSKDLFEAETIERMAGHYAQLIRALVAEPDLAISSVSILDAVERQLLEGWNRTEVDYGPARCVHELIEEEVALRPEAEAVSFGDERLTYGELNMNSNRLANRLRSLGVGPEIRVGVYLERSLEMIVGLVAILKAGGAYVPLDPSYPTDRLAYMVEDAAPLVILTKSDLFDALPSRPQRLLIDDMAEFALESAENLPSIASPANAAYIIYTSGSTGRPKGVLNTHSGVMNRLMWQIDHYDFRASDRILQKTPFAFDVSVWELFAPLLCRASLVVAEPGGHRDPHYLGSLIEAQQISILHFVPSMLQEFLRSGVLVHCRSLRKVFCSGEALTPEVQKEFYRQCDWAELHNLYGPTEAAVDVTSWSCRETDDRSTVPIGRPIANTQIYILDEAMERVPVGLRGELYIGGAGLARGYWGQPGLTAERFVPDPWASGERLYRTGDLARYRNDGEIDFLGRNDAQVKIRGFRIELGEIEAVLRSHPQVNEAAVIVHEPKTGDHRLIAYVVGETAVAPSILLTYCHQTLPDYMVPSVFVSMEHLPLTPSGKLDRRSLPPPDLSRLSAENTFVMPSTPTEELVASIWREVLGRERVGVEDNFFADLGGHSLLATQVISRIRTVFSVELPLRSLFEEPTVAGLSRQIETTAKPDSAQQPIRRRENRDIMDLSYGQERLWFLDRLRPGETAYNIPVSVRLRGELDVEALRLALEGLVRRHETLRTSFHSDGGRAMQKVELAERTHTALPVVEIDGSPEDQERECARLTQDEAGRPFDLRRGPLLRVHLLRLQGEEHMLLLTLHHIVSDGWSMGVLVRELGALYEAARLGHDARLPELTVQYADYALWQREWLQGEVLEEQLSYWRKQLEGVALLQLSTDRPRPAIPTQRGGRIPVALRRDVANQLRALGQREGITMFMLLLAGFQVLLARYSGQSDIAVGTAIANRTRREVEGLIGFFVNTLVLRTKVDGEMSFRHLAARVREGTLGAYAHQDLPFERLVEELRPERDLAHTPLFQVSFALQNLPMVELKVAGLTLQAQAVENGTTKFDITLSLTEHGDGSVAGSIEYSKDLFDEETIARMAVHYSSLMEGLAADPDRAISSVSILGVDERRQLEEWNLTEVGYGPARCVHELVEDQAALRPEAEAVLFGEERLTYNDLNAQANQLANRLRSLGVGPEARVGVYLERGLEMIVSLLAVMKAGGAYVPLDPSFPTDRLTYMVQDAAPLVVITQRSLSHTLPTDTQCLLVDDMTEFASESTKNLQSIVSPANAAYVIYTSGSTGRPKGVLISHQNLWCFLSAMRTLQFVDPSSKWLAVTTISFDIAAFELFFPIAYGGRLQIAPRAMLEDGKLFQRALASDGVRILQGAPAMWQVLVESGLHLPDGLTILSGGEALPADLAGRLFRSTGRLRNLYGPTETTIWSASAQVTEQHLLGNVVSIGRPIANTQIFILDDAMEPVPVGLPGELYIGGAGLARGYWGRPELTAERFVPSPFASGQRLYRTGDLARHRSDGEIDFLGRNDTQVKIRGFRIEPGEIEAVLRKYAGIQNAVVVAREDRPGDRRLVAYVVGDERVTSSALRIHCRQSLPDYMVPSVCVVLERLPLTPNGKLDRSCLPAPDSARPDLANTFLPPTNDLELTVAEVWSETLGVERVGVEDNFFDLGGNSLLLVRVHSLLQERLGRDLAVVDLFRYPTVVSLGSFLSMSSEHAQNDVDRFTTVGVGKVRLNQQLAKRRANKERA